jgi:hypothetical protein
MPGYRTAYPPEFRRQMVDLVRSGRTPEELALEFRADRTVDFHLGEASRAQMPASALTGRQALSGRSTLIVASSRLSASIHIALFDAGRRVTYAPRQSPACTPLNGPFGARQNRLHGRPPLVADPAPPKEKAACRRPSCGNVACATTRPQTTTASLCFGWRRRRRVRQCRGASSPKSTPPAPARSRL